MSSAQQRIRGRSMRKRVGIGVLAAALVSPALVACGSDSGITINVYYGPEENFQSVVDNCNAQAGGAYKIVYNKLPRDADGQRQQMVRRLAASDDALDILGLDVTWVPEFAKAGWLKPWTGADEEAAKADVLDGPLKTAMYDGKLYAATKNTNVQLLWYDDRVTGGPLPDNFTFDQMIQKAQQLKASGSKRYQILFTGAQYEGLVVFYNTLTASAGGHILSDDGSKVVMDQGAVNALGLLKKIATSGVTSPALTSAQEQQVQLGFQNADGAGAFELNWPFVYASMQSAAKDDPSMKESLQHMKWTRYPSVDGTTPSKVTIGGFNLAVSTYSKHPEQSFKAALCLRSKDSQKFSAIKDGVPPTLGSLYTDDTPLDASKPANADDNPSMATAYPMRQDIKDAVSDAAVRPLTPIYQNASTVISKLLSPPQDIDPNGTANELKDQLQLALDSKGVLP